MRSALHRQLPSHKSWGRAPGVTSGQAKPRGLITANQGQKGPGDQVALPLTGYFSHSHPISRKKGSMVRNAFVASALFEQTTLVLLTLTGLKSVSSRPNRVATAEHRKGGSPAPYGLPRSHNRVTTQGATYPLCLRGSHFPRTCSAPSDDHNQCSVNCVL